MPDGTIKCDLGGLPDSCGSPLYLAPLGGLCLPNGKHAGILTQFQTQVNKKKRLKRIYHRERGGRRKKFSHELTRIGTNVKRISVLDSRCWMLDS